MCARTVGARKGIIDKLSVFIILAPREAERTEEEAVTGWRMEGGPPGLPSCLKGLSNPTILLADSELLYLPFLSIW